MGYVKWSYETLNHFCGDVFKAFGFTEEESNQIKDVLLTADLYGIESHGMQRMVRYHKGIEKGTIHPQAKPEVVFETPISAVIDGHNGMGQLISVYAMKKAIEKAKKTGVGIVTVRESNHFGIAGYYAKMACDEGLLGMACTNSEAIMVPTFGKKAMLGSNPIAVAMPADPYPFFFDCSTTVVTRGKLEMYNKMEKPLPNGWRWTKMVMQAQTHRMSLPILLQRRAAESCPLVEMKRLQEATRDMDMVCYVNCSVPFFPWVLLRIIAAHSRIKLESVMDSWQSIRLHLVILRQSADIFQNYLEALRESPKAEGKDRIYTHGEKEVLAEKDRREHGLPVNDNTMVELANLCGYLGLDFNKYFDGYELPKESKFFTGNY